MKRKYKKIKYKKTTSKMISYNKIIKIKNPPRSLSLPLSFLWWGRNLLSISLLCFYLDMPVASYHNSSQRLTTTLWDDLPQLVEESYSKSLGRLCTFPYLLCSQLVIRMFRCALIWESYTNLLLPK